MNTIKAALLAIGDEILIGQITDTNSVFLAEHLTLSGIQINEMQTVGDSREQIFEALDCSLRKNDMVLLTGGLGPTDDDLTKAVLAEYFKTDLIVNEAVLSDVEEFVQSRGFEVNQLNRQQAEVPRNCRVIRNANGTAPGMWFEHGRKVIVSMPAVPFEMREMFSEKVLPMLRKQFELPVIAHRTILTHGIPESQMAEKLQEIEGQLPAHIKLAYLPSPERLRLRLNAKGDDMKEMQLDLEKEAEKIRALIGKAVYGEGDIFLEHALNALLKERGKTLSTAESCTGGNIAAKITSVAGSSAIFLGGTVAYSNKVKINQLGVPVDAIEKKGAVSKEVAEAMVKGALALYGSDYAVAVTGIAGPEGGTPEKPVGTVWIAVGNERKILSKKYMFGKRRDINIRRASAKALDMLRKFILDFYEK